MAATKRPVTQTIYQLKVTLKHLRPPVWRRLQVPSDWTLAQLHRAIQSAMGWSDSHLHRFTIDGKEFGDPRISDDLGFRDERKTRLESVVRGEKTQFVYEYDFGDSWEHEILAEKILPAAPSEKYPVCLAGRRACPPEDCGGVWGYAHLLEVLSNPRHKEHAEMQEWVGGAIDPEAFDLEAVNKALRRIR